MSAGRADVAAALPAETIARRLGLHPPTPEQRAVIEADPRAQCLVVAGAGSGKTETMANRVVWLLANGHVDVAEVLGLTFTRKAAGELAERIRERIGQLAADGLAPAPIDPLDSATVATYHSFASAIFREHALLIGREPDSTVLGEAAAWQLARQVAAASADPRLVELDASLERVTEAVLSLSRGLAENVADSRDVQAFAREFLAMHDLPIGAPRKRTPFATFTAALGVVDALPPLLDLADAYAEAKRARGFVEFSDQVALALEICRRRPEVVVEHRDRFRAVLLDEYQDTSVVQTELLATLFAGRPVMAVGDPDQSIYGWRGASAANLATFGDDFGDEPPVVFDLSTSWRNPRRVLDAANALIAPLGDDRVPKAALRASPVAADGAVVAHWSETIDEEAEVVAAWFSERLGRGRTGALLCRTFANVEVFAAALRARGIPVQVLGVAGLLEQPVVVDLVCALRALHDPTAGSELVRLLGGARWRVGAADLAALGRLARWLAERDHASRRLDDGVRRGIRSSIAAEESPSLVDALDVVLSAPDDHRALAGFTADALARLRRAGAQLQALRRRVGLGLVDFVHLVQQELLLDVEVAANDDQPLGEPSLDAFDDLLAAFVDAAEHPTLGGFLGWLAEAEQRDRLAPRQEEPEPGAVQVLTIHGAKGLEWDLVAVPRLVEGEIPSAPRTTKGWLAFGELPYPFRGDRDELPDLQWRGVQSQAEFDEAVAGFAAENRDRHADEERRLAYVAVTRARAELLLTGSWWSSQRGARPPSPFLREIAAAGVIDASALPAVPRDDENPRLGADDLLTWPLDPLGRRRAPVLAAADGVRAAAAGPTGAGIGPELAHELRMLLEERRRRRDGGESVAVPVRVSASRFKDYVDDPFGAARQLGRPMPQRPFRATRLGTLFHTWVEHRSTGVGEIAAVDAADPTALPFVDDVDLGDEGLAGAVLDDASAARLAELQATFAASEWGARKPIAVELELHLPLAGHVFVCKIDAVYDVPPGSELEGRGIRAQVVDWKTGRAPRDARDLELKQTQLALYRLAYARWTGLEPDQIDAVFYFVEDDRVVRPSTLSDEASLVASWSAAVGAGASGGAASPQSLRSSGIGAVAFPSESAPSFEKS